MDAARSRTSKIMLVVAAIAAAVLVAALALPGGAQAALVTAQAEQAVQAAAAPNAAPARTDASKVGISYSVHLQNKGWKKAVKDGKTAGAAGKGLRVEGLKVKLTGLGTNKGHVQYQAYVQKKGWRKVVTDGAKAGITGKSLRTEAVKIKLTDDIAKHYDVYYRVYLQKKGWQVWKKNGTAAGAAGKGLRVEALQVKLSPKTEEAAGKGTAKVGVRYDGYVQKKGWQLWKGDGSSMGAAGKGLRLEGLNAVVSPGAYSGGITYQAYVQGVGWQALKKNGSTAGLPGKNKRVEALRFNLTGDLATHYDVYYRTYVPGYGWLDWASNGANAGSTGHKLRIEAFQVRLVKKGASAPGNTTYPTVNKLKSTLDGIDISSWQYDINVAKVKADFVIVKATGGTGYTNPYFRKQADAAVKSGKLLGLYHFAREKGCAGTAEKEADYFVKAIKGYEGKAVLVLDWEADALSLSTSWAKKWLDRVYSKTKVRPLIYMSKSYTRSTNWSSVAKDYKLWVAQYPDYKRTGYLTKPWTDAYGYGAWSAPTIFQYTSSGKLSGYSGNLDLNKFYGNATAWRKLAAKS